MLSEKLTIKQQKELLESLFGFSVINVDENYGGEHWVIYDEWDNEFYGTDENVQFDLSTLKGIIDYAVYDAKKKGYLDCQRKIRNLLGIL